MNYVYPIRQAIMMFSFFCLIVSATSAHAKEVDFLDLPFGAKRSEIKNLFDKKSVERGHITNYLRKEKDMRFAGMQLYGVYYGFDKDMLVVVEAITFPADPVKAYCYDIKAAKAIRNKMTSLFGRRIRHVGDYSSPPEEFNNNYADFKECIDAFPGKKNVSCEVDVFEKWKAGAKETDRALEAALQEVSIGNNPVVQCVLRLTFRPGRPLSDKLAEEINMNDLDELFGIE